MNYFVCLGGTGTDSRKSAIGHVTLNLLFCPPVGSAGHVVHCGASRARNVATLFFLLGWDRYGFHNKCSTKPYVELVFLHLVVSACHVVHFGASAV
jgi:hypothetical protein